GEAALHELRRRDGGRGRRGPVRRLHPARDGPPGRRSVHRPPVAPEARAGGEEGQEAGEGGLGARAPGATQWFCALSLASLRALSVLAPASLAPSFSLSPASLA